MPSFSPAPAEYLQSLFYQSPNPLLILDAGGVVRLVNPAAERILGRPLEALCGTPLAFACEPGKTIEQWVVRPDGVQALCEVHTAAIHLQGEACFLVTLHDITTHKELLHALEESEKRFRILIDFTYDWEYWLSPNGDLLYVSNACKRITGYAAEEFMSDPLLFERIIHPEDRKRVLAHVAEELEYYNLSSIDFRIVTRDGHIHWVNSQSRPVFDAQKGYLGRRFSNREITDRKKTEIKLLETEQRFRSFIEQSQDGMFLVDVNGNVIVWNRAQEDISGLKSEAVLGHPLWEVRAEYLGEDDVTGLQSQKGKEKLLAVLKSGSGDLLGRLWEIELPALLRGPVESGMRFIQERYFCIPTERGYQIGCIVRDISEEKNAQSALQQMNLELEARVATRTRQLTEEIGARKTVEQQLSRRLQHERIVAEISAHFIRNDEFGTAVGAVLQLLGSLTGAKRILFYAAQEYGGTFVCTHIWQQGLFTTRLKQTSQMAAQALPSCLLPLKTGQRMYLKGDELQRLPKDFFGAALHNEEKPNNLLFQPINAYLHFADSPGIVGFLAFEEIALNLEEGTEEIGLLEVAAQMIAAAMERSRFMEMLEQRVRDRTRELEALYEVAAMTIRSLGVDEILQMSLEKMMDVMGSATGFVHLLAKDGRTFYLAQQCNVPPAALEAIRVLVWEDSPLGKVYGRFDPLLISDLGADSGWPADLYCRYPAYIGVPMRIGGQLLGVFSLLQENVAQLKLEQLTLLSAIADQVAAALESARLREHAQEAAVMEERHRLARELHDSITQYLYSLTLLTRGWQRKLREASGDEVAYWLERAGSIANQALKEMRLLLYNLRPHTLEQDGLVGALRRRLEAVEGRVEIKTLLQVDEDLEIPAWIESELYGIAQEALNNILKHAEATRVEIHLRKQTGAVVLEISDNGNGFNPAALGEDGRLGITSMRERAKKLGSQLVIDSRAGKGTRVKVHVRL